MKKSWAGAVCLSLAAGIWGRMYVVSKYVLEYIPPFTLVWLRFIIALAVLFTLLKHSQKGIKPKYTKQDYLLFAWIGFIGYFVSILCQFIGTKLSDAHTGALLTSATPAFVVLFAGVILKEKITPRKLISVLLATIGVITVIGYKQNMEYSGSRFPILLFPAIDGGIFRMAAFERRTESVFFSGRSLYNCRCYSCFSEKPGD